MEYKELGTISISITWLGLLFVLYRWPGHRGLTFSQHIAPKRSSQIYYFFLFAITLPLFCVFINRWFIPTLELPQSFGFFVGLAIAGQLVAVSIPEIKGWKQTVHFIAAGVMSFALAPMCLQIALASTASSTAKVVASISAIYMTIVWLIVLSYKKTQNIFLYLQSSYVAAFHLTILISTYVK